MKGDHCTLAAAALLVAALHGCAAKPPAMSPALAPAPSRDWSVVRDSAERAMVAGRSEEADRLLLDFLQRHPDSPEGRESMFWRALLLLDPSSFAGPGEAANAFDSYLRAGADLPHRSEAVALRLVAVHLDSLVRTRKTAAAGVASSDHADAAREEELKKLRLELKATQEELDRIKRRLTAPKP